MLYQSLFVSVVYYGAAVIVDRTGIFVPDLRKVALVVGGGIIPVTFWVRAQIQEQSYLAAPERPKAPGECIRSKFLLANISDAMKGQSRSAALGINWGYHYVQMGDLDAAMREFEKAARYFAYRDFSQMKLALRLLFLICQAQKRRTPLEKWSLSLGLDVDVSAGPEGLLSAFPHPFPEAQIYPLPSVTKDPKVVQIDFGNPNKTINGFGSSRISQVWFCTRYDVTAPLLPR